MENLFIKEFKIDTKGTTNTDDHSIVFEYDVDQDGNKTGKIKLAYEIDGIAIDEIGLFDTLEEAEVYAKRSYFIKE